VISRKASAIASTDGRGRIHILAASLGALLLGPGTSVSHQAMVLLAESASTVVWAGERGVRYYAHGRSRARSLRLLDAQARVVSNRNLRLGVARRMYSMWFPGEDVEHLTMQQQLRGREGARVRKAYREHAERTGVEWNRRDYRPEDFDASDLVNQALSAANTALYGVVHSVIVALGCAPGLGVVHTGHERSFVYDIADLYKAEMSIPVAFDVVSQDLVDVGAAARRAMRDVMFARVSSNVVSVTSPHCSWVRPTRERARLAGPTSSCSGTRRELRLPGVPRTRKHPGQRTGRTSDRRSRDRVSAETPWAAHPVAARDLRRRVRRPLHRGGARQALGADRRTRWTWQSPDGAFHARRTTAGVPRPPP
jgi:CRISPR-associated protein Cas1